MALFGGRKIPPRITTPLDPKWVRSPSGGFYRLSDVDPDRLGLRTMGGVYVIWHRGVRPAWVFAGESPSLGRALEAAADNPEIDQYRIHGGLFVSWSPISEEYRRGALLFLTRALKPLVTNPRAPTEESETTQLVPVIAPGGKLRGA